MSQHLKQCLNLGDICFVMLECGGPVHPSPGALGPSRLYQERWFLASLILSPPIHLGLLRDGEGRAQGSTVICSGLPSLERPEET